MKSFIIIIVAMLGLTILGNLVQPQQQTGRVIVSWDPNSEADLKGYKVYYGVQSLVYSNHVDVGNITNQIINGLELGRRWYFAVTAYDTAWNESSYSDEVSIYLDSDGSGDSTIVTVNMNYYNFPNPFDPNKEWTHIRYFLAATSQVSILIYDSGENFVRELFKNEDRQPGEHFEPWDGRDRYGIVVKNGIYLAVVTIGDVKKVVQIGVIR